MKRENDPMTMDSLFQCIAEHRRRHQILRQIHLTLSDEMDLYRDLLEQSHRLSDEIADRLHQDRRYIRAYLATIDNIPVVWSAPAFKLE